jgi:hypothetical protein
MRSNQSRLGVLPALLVGLAFTAIGIVVLSWLLNDIWPISPRLTDEQFIEVQRGIAEDRFASGTLLQISNAEAVALFLVAAGVTAMGIMMPLAYFVNRRVQVWLRARDDRHFEQETGQKPPTRMVLQTSLFVLMRQGFWFGLWVSFCLWLQINRTFGFAVAGLVAIVLILLELLLLMRALTTQRTAGQQPQRSKA